MEWRERSQTPWVSHNQVPAVSPSSHPARETPEGRGAFPAKGAVRALRRISDQGARIWDAFRSEVFSYIQLQIPFQGLFLDFIDGSPLPALPQNVYKPNKFIKCGLLLGDWRRGNVPLSPANDWK